MDKQDLNKDNKFSSEDSHPINKINTINDTNKTPLHVNRQKSGSLSANSNMSTGTEISASAAKSYKETVLSTPKPTIVIHATRCDNFEYIVPHRHNTYIYYIVVNIRTMPMRYNIFKIIAPSCVHNFLPPHMRLLLTTYFNNMFYRK